MIGLFILNIMCFVSILKGVVHYFYFLVKNKKYYRTKGVVVDNYLDKVYSSGSHDPGHEYYFPIIEFTDNNGESVQIQSDNYNPDRPMYEVGTKVSLLVNPEDNTRFIFDEKADRLIIPLVWIGLGIIGLMISSYCSTHFPE